MELFPYEGFSLKIVPNMWWTHNLTCLLQNILPRDFLYFPGPMFCISLPSGPPAGVLPGKALELQPSTICFCRLDDNPTRCVRYWWRQNLFTDPMFYLLTPVLATISSVWTISNRKRVHKYVKHCKSFRRWEVKQLPHELWEGSLKIFLRQTFRKHLNIFRDFVL